MGRRKKPTRKSPRSNPVGTISITAAGYGFTETAEGSFFIPASKIAGAFDGDTVELAPIRDIPSKRKGEKPSGTRADRPSARVLRVLHRAHEIVIGRYEVAEPFGVVVSQDHRIPYDIFTMLADNPDIPDGSLVRVRMVQYPSRNTAATGVIEEVLGECDDSRMDVEIAIGRARLETCFSESALEEVSHARVDANEALLQGYVDLRSRFVFTIDPEDARDFDDAISLQEKPDGCLLLGVHIADVSHYVEWGSSVDLDARRRATSVYLVDRVIPMLPEKLSGDICSLVPGKPRLAMTLDALIAPDGRVISSQLYPSVIESKARLSYEGALCYMETSGRGEGWQAAKDRVARIPAPRGFAPLSDFHHETLYKLLPRLSGIAKLRADMRRERGGIDFDTKEAKVRLDGQGIPIGVAVRTKNEATSAIEEAMLLANECTARKLCNGGVPGMFRVHAAPSPDSLAAILPIIREFDYLDDVDSEAFIAGDSFELQKVLVRCGERTEGQLVTQLLLRAMQRARYSEHCDPHYALSSEAYCHFTSPIRRYPDLVVHRMLKTRIFGRSGTFSQQADSIGWLAEHSSQMERIAERVAAETQEIKLVEYMQRFIGMTMNGLVCGIAPNGLYVQLDNTAEGLLPIRELGSEYFSFDPELYLLLGSESGKCYRLGQRIRVVIAAAPPHQRRLEFRLAPKG